MSQRSIPADRGAQPGTLSTSAARQQQHPYAPTPLSAFPATPNYAAHYQHQLHQQPHQQDVRHHQAPPPPPPPPTAAAYAEQQQQQQRQHLSPPLPGPVSDFEPSRPGSSGSSQTDNTPNMSSSFDDYYRRDRQRQIESVANAQLERYSHRRSPSDSIRSSPGSMHDINSYPEHRLAPLRADGASQQQQQQPQQPSPLSPGDHYRQKVFHYPTLRQPNYVGGGDDASPQAGMPPGATMGEYSLWIQQGPPPPSGPPPPPTLGTQGGIRPPGQVPQQAPVQALPPQQQQQQQQQPPQQPPPPPPPPATPPQRPVSPPTDTDERIVRKRYTRKPIHHAPPPKASAPEEPYMREAFALDPDMDLTLASLKDPPVGERPGYALPMLAALAIHGSPRRRLTLQEIYKALQDRFDWFDDHKDDKSWKNSVRHNLSLNKIFRQMPRPITEPGKGHYWVLDFSDGVGNKRTRKRRPKGAAAVAAAAAAAAVAGIDHDAGSEEPEERVPGPSGRVQRRAERASPYPPSAGSGGASPLDDGAGSAGGGPLRRAGVVRHNSSGVLSSAGTVSSDEEDAGADVVRHPMYYHPHPHPSSSSSQGTGGFGPPPPVSHFASAGGQVPPPPPPPPPPRGQEGYREVMEPDEYDYVSYGDEPDPRTGNGQRFGQSSFAFAQTGGAMPPGGGARGGAIHPHQQQQHPHQHPHPHHPQHPHSMHPQQQQQQQGAQFSGLPPIQVNTQPVAATQRPPPPTQGTMQGYGHPRG